ncbi:MAG TPA: hypothetical protein VE422_00115 [Terriglobia bacterium]|nr:hypothetical protein [Terriglobia bacterium]
MTKILRLFFCLAVPLVLATAASAQAGALVVKVPFDFYVDNTPMTSGTYVVRLTDNRQILQLNGQDTHKGVFSMSNPASSPAAPNKNALVFTRYGNQYFLSEVHWAEGRIARQLLKREAEIEIAKRFTGTQITATSSK